MAFFNPQAVVDSCAAPLSPLPASRPTYWVFNELGGLLFGEIPKVCGMRGKCAMRLWLGVCAATWSAGCWPFCDGCGGTCCCCRCDKATSAVSALLLRCVPPHS